MKSGKIIFCILLEIFIASSLSADLTIWGKDYDQQVRQDFIGTEEGEIIYYELRSQPVNFGYYEYLVVLKNFDISITVDFCVDELMNILHPDDYSITMNIPLVRQILYCGIYQSLELDKENSSVSKLVFKVNYGLTGSEGLVLEQIDTWIFKNGTFVLNPGLD
jgi:hypothetical protein